MTSKYRFTIVLVASAVMALLMGGLVFGLVGTQPAPAAAQTNSGEPRTITVVGEGKVKAKPDVAQAIIGVEIIRPEAKQASADAETTMTSVIDALTAQGVAAGDIQTSYYNIYVERPYGYDSSQSNDVLYHVSNTVQVNIRDLSKVTTILGAAIEAGANTINGVTFDVAAPAELKASARQQAVENAKASAENLAQLSGVTLGEVVSVSEVVQGGSVPLYREFAAAQGIGGGGPILPGDVEVAVQLQVAYAIQ